MSGYVSGWCVAAYAPGNTGADSCHGKGASDGAPFFVSAILNEMANRITISALLYAENSHGSGIKT